MYILYSPLAVSFKIAFLLNPHTDSYMLNDLLVKRSLGWAEISMLACPIFLANKILICLLEANRLSWVPVKLTKGSNPVNNSTVFLFILEMITALTLSSDSVTIIAWYYPCVTAKEPGRWAVDYGDQLFLSRWESWWALFNEVKYITDSINLAAVHTTTLCLIWLSAMGFETHFRCKRESMKNFWAWLHSLKGIS